MTTQEFLQQWYDDTPHIKVHTSGSTGKPKDIWLQKRHVRASAETTCNFLQLKKGNRALLCLPTDYIAGKMMVVRAEVLGMELIEIPSSSAPLSYLLEHKDLMEKCINLAAMIPMQVINSLKEKEQRKILQGIEHIIIGGGAIDKSLAEELKDFPNHVWSTYGMTETISHIALRRLNGQEASEWYEPFKDVDVSLTPESCLRIHAPQIAIEDIITNDLAEIDSDGRRFRIIGRRDNVINSGGLKIQIEEVENLLSSKLEAPFAITRLPHPTYGECVTLITTSQELEEIKNICHETLPHHWIPKVFLHTNNIPMTNNGKVARKEVEILALNLKD